MYNGIDIFIIYIKFHSKEYISLLYMNRKYGITNDFFIILLHE